MRKVIFKSAVPYGKRVRNEGLEVMASHDSNRRPIFSRSASVQTVTQQEKDCFVPGVEGTGRFKILFKVLNRGNGS